MIATSSTVTALVVAMASSGAIWVAATVDTPYERHTNDAGDHFIAVQFQNFNRDMVAIGFPLKQEAVRESMAEFGYAPGDLGEVLNSCNGPCKQEQFDAKMLEHYRSRGLFAEATAPGRFKVHVDVPAAVARNKARVRSLAIQLDQSAVVQAYGADDALNLAIAMVQTSFTYKLPPDEENGREILGFYPPPRTLEAGFGDCDSKTALLGAILANFPAARMIGVHIPKHYLIGIARLPRSGDAYIEYNGEPYVLIEASGPAWRPPGLISQATEAALATSNGVRIDPL